MLSVNDAKKKDVNGILLFSVFVLTIIFLLTRQKLLIGAILMITLYQYIFVGEKLIINKASKNFINFWIYYLVVTLFYNFILYRTIDMAILMEFFGRLAIVVASFIIGSAINKNEKFLILYRNFGFLICILGLVEYVLKENIIYRFYNFFDSAPIVIYSESYRIYTIFAHPIVFGTFLIPLFWIKKEYPFKSIILDKIFLVMIILNICFTQSRSCWIALGITLILNIFLSSSKFEFKKICLNKYIYMIVSTCLLLFIIIFFRKPIFKLILSIVNRFSVVLANDSMDGSRVQRLGSIKVVFLYISKHLVSGIFGSGLGFSTGFMKKYSPTKGFLSIDNQYMHSLLEVGMIGVYFFVNIILYLVKNLKLFYKEKKTKIGALSSISILICIFFFVGFSWYPILCMFTIFISFLNVEDKIEGD